MPASPLQTQPNPATHGMPVTQWAELLQFNVQLLTQALGVVAAYTAPLPSGTAPFGQFVGPHLRHVIEHFDALMASCSALPPTPVDYDVRQRDRQLETQPPLAGERLMSLQAQLQTFRANPPRGPIQVRFCGGLDGVQQFTANSSVERELLFVASHAIHHFAQIQIHCASQGISLPANFGKAPATIAHARGTASSKVVQPVSV